MAKKANARRYAQAVFELALEKKEMERWQADLAKLAGATGDADFLAALESPRLKPEAKGKLLAEALGDINPLAMNLARLLIARSAIGIAGEVSAEYGRLLDGYRGVEPAQVITAVPIDAAETQKLERSLSALVGKKVAVKAEVDPGITGGFIARVGGKLLDGSTRSQLAALRRELVGAEGRR